MSTKLERVGGEETRQAWKPSSSMTTPASVDDSQGHASEVKKDRSPEEELVLSEMKEILNRLKLKPGQDCVLNDGLVTVDLACYHQPSSSSIGILIRPEATSDMQARKNFAEIKAKTAVLKSIGWCSAVIATGSWLKLKDLHEKTHSLVDTLNESLTEGNKQHEHHSGCGCSH